MGHETNMKTLIRVICVYLPLTLYEFVPAALPDTASVTKA